MEAARTKRVRTCVGCGKQSSKDDLYRIVRTADNGVLFDKTGRVSGRGAYICSPECFEAAYRQRKLNRALRTGINEENASRIAEELRAARSDVTRC